MGIVLNQSVKNTFITLIGFSIGAINALFLYTLYLGQEHFGIVVFVLSAANILMPLFSFGIQSTLIRFYSKYISEYEKDVFLSFMLLFPIVITSIIVCFFFFFFPQFTNFIFFENPKVVRFLWLIPIIGIFMGYFEIFYAWVKVHFYSVFGIFLSEVLTRVLVFFMLLLVSQNCIQKDTFIISLSLIYGIQCFGMMIFAFKVKRPKIIFRLPIYYKEIIIYSLYIIAISFVTVMLVDFDKVVIPVYHKINNNAFYSVAVFIAMVIIIPSRAMTQIIYPITAQLVNDKKWNELNVLYKKSAINLQVIGGLFMLEIFLNCKQMYHLIPIEYSGGIGVVFLIGLSKFYDLLIGNNSAILLNTKFYKWFLFFGILIILIMIWLYLFLIPIYGIIGAALATLISVIISNSIKLSFVYFKLNLFPFSNKTIQSFFIIFFVFLLFYFWDFNFNPILNILFKSILILLVYTFLNFKFKIASELNQIVNNFVNRFVK